MEADNDNVVFYLQRDFQEKMLGDDRRWDASHPTVFPEVYNAVFAQLFVDAVFY